MVETTELVTTAQVAQDHGVSVKTVLRMANTGQLPYVRKLPTRTGAFLFDSAEVKRVFAERAEGTEQVSA